MRIAGTASASVSVSDRSRSSTVRASVVGPATRIARDPERDRRHVVVAARVVGSPHESPHGLVERSAASDQARDRSVPDQTGQTVGAEQQDVAVPYLHDAGVDIELGTGAERACDHRALRVHRRLLARQATGALELGDQRVVVRELLQHAVAQEVRARVADVAEHHVIAVEQRRRDRRPHARRRRIALRPLEHASVRLEDRAAQAHLGILAGSGRELAEGLDCKSRCQLSCACSSHAVCDDEQGRIVEVGVLVRASHPAGVARARVVGDAHGRYSSYLSSVSPTRTSSPARRRCSATSACPATCVPFVEPRSST